MADKIHWKTAQKLAKEWSVDSIKIKHIPDTPLGYSDDAVEVLEVDIKWKPFNVYDKRANLVAYAHSEKEANKLLETFLWGFKRPI